MLNFKRLHEGYWRAETTPVGDDMHGDEYVVRTRPLGDGWMVIRNEYVVATGVERRSEAVRICQDMHAYVPTEADLLLEAA